jgi:hypothetical protein
MRNFLLWPNIAAALSPLPRRYRTQQEDTMRLDLRILIRSSLMVAIAGAALVGAAARADDDDEGHHWKHRHGYYVVPPGHVYYVAPPPVVYYPQPVYVPAYPMYTSPPGVNLNFNVPLR